MSTALTAAGSRPLRLVLAVALTCAFTWSISKALGLGSATAYGVVVAALLLRPDFQPNPARLLVALPVVVVIGLALGTGLKPLLEAPMVWQFAIVTAFAQILGQALPDQLMAMRNILAVLAVLPLLGSNATWLGAWHQSLAVVVGILVATLIQQAFTLPGDRLAKAGAAHAAKAPDDKPRDDQADASTAGEAGSPPAQAPVTRQEQAASRRPDDGQAGVAASGSRGGASGAAAARAEGTAQAATTGKDAAAGAEAELPGRSIGARFADPFFWRKLVVAMLALSIGLGVGATNPKYLYFGVVLLLGESVGATLERVRDRMLGVTLGVLMPWLVFNTFSINALSVGMVLGGTTALMVSLRLMPHLRTALISSGVTFVGYGALTDWYIPTRWLDYLMGCGLALLVCLLVRPVSALRRFQQLAEGAAGMTDELRQLLPSALEEARLLGQVRGFRAQLERLEGNGKK